MTCFRKHNATIESLDASECGEIGLEAPKPEEECDSGRETCKVPDWVVTDWSKCGGGGSEENDDEEAINCGEKIRITFISFLPAAASSTKLVDNGLLFFFSLWRKNDPDRPLVTTTINRFNGDTTKVFKERLLEVLLIQHIHCSTFYTGCFTKLKIFTSMNF